MYILTKQTRFLKLLGFFIETTIIIEASFGFLIAFENTIRMSADSLIASARALIVWEVAIEALTDSPIRICV